MASIQSSSTVRGVEPTSVDGLKVSHRKRPSSKRELGDFLKAASSSGRTVIPVGGQTSLSLGNVPARADMTIEMGELSQILEYAPDDLTVSIEAGTTLAEVSTVLADNAQMLPIEVPVPDQATIGGILASGLYGPRRLGSGTLRDYMIGIEVAYSDGSVAKAGGMVVKNVSGFDLMRMHNGALGTLGVIVSANFKVLPKPRTEKTVTAHFETREDFAHFWSDMSKMIPGLVSAELQYADPGWSASWRIEGRPGSVDSAVERLRQRLPGGHDLLEPEQSVSFWQAYIDQTYETAASGGSWIRIRETPRNGFDALDDSVSALGPTQLREGAVRLSPGLGSVDLLIRAEDTRGSDIRSIIQRLRIHRPHTVLLAGPPDAKIDIDVYHETTESLELMRMLKAEFDPSNTLNPGRFAGFL